MAVGPRSSGRTATAEGKAISRKRRSRPAETPEMDADRVFDTLRDNILDHRLSPGMQLKEQPLADAFRVNRAVIRQALAKLEIFGLATHQPNRGVFVASPSMVEGREIFAARRYIESAVIDLLVSRASAETVAVLREHVAREQAAYASHDFRTALRLSIDFHRELARLAGNGVLASFLEELVARTPLVMLSSQTLESPSCVQNEHQAILDAIEKGDAAVAGELMCTHIAHLEKRLENGFGAAGYDAAEGVAARLRIAR